MNQASSFALFLLARLNYVFGGPLPTHLVPSAVILSDVVFFTAVLVIMSWNYSKAEPVGRRRVKWVLFGAYLAAMPSVLMLIGPVIGASHQLIQPFR